LEYIEVDAYVNPCKELHFGVDLICHNCQLLSASNCIIRSHSWVSLLPGDHLPT